MSVNWQSLLTKLSEKWTRTPGGVYIPAGELKQLRQTARPRSRNLKDLREALRRGATASPRLTLRDVLREARAEQYRRRFGPKIITLEKVYRRIKGLGEAAAAIPVGVAGFTAGLLSRIGGAISAAGAGSPGGGGGNGGGRPSRGRSRTGGERRGGLLSRLFGRLTGRSRLAEELERLQKAHRRVGQKMLKQKAKIKEQKAIIQSLQGELGKSRGLLSKYKYYGTAALVGLPLLAFILGSYLSPRRSSEDKEKFRVYKF